MQRSEEQLTTVLINPPELKIPTQRKRMEMELHASGGISCSTGAILEVECQGYILHPSLHTVHF